MTSKLSRREGNIEEVKATIEKLGKLKENVTTSSKRIHL